MVQETREDDKNSLSTARVCVFSIATQAVEVGAMSIEVKLQTHTYLIKTQTHIYTALILKHLALILSVQKPLETKNKAVKWENNRM